MHKVFYLEKGNLVDDDDIGEEKNCGGGDRGKEPPHLFTSP